MTAQPVATVPNAIKAPPAPTAGGHGLRSFIDYLGSAASGLGAPKGLLGSTALATSLHAKKLAFKDAQNALRGNAANAHAPDPSVAAGLPIVLAGVPSGLSAKGADGATGATPIALASLPGSRAVIIGDPALASSASPGATANSSVPAPANANSFTGLIAAGSSLAAEGSGADTTSTSGTALPGTPAPNPNALPTALNEATPTVTPAGSAPPRQAASPATAFMVNQFGAPGATSANDPAAKPSSAGTSDKQPSETASSDPSIANPPAPSGGGNPITTIPGAAALNARIIAGASTLSDHPNQAATPASDALTQPADPNAGALPPSASTADDKGHDTSLGFGGASAGGAASGPTAGANAATDPRNFAAAVDHATAQTQAATSPADSGKSNGGSSGDAASASAATSTPNLSLAQADPTAGGAAQLAAPNDASLHPALIALPASVQVAINLKQALSNATDEIQIQLKPASLGTIDVKLNVNHDGRLTAVISADRSDTLNLLKQDASQLQQSLRDAGFSADGGSLSFNLRSDTQSFAQNAAPQFASGPSAAPDLPPPGAFMRAPRQHNGALDIEV